MTSFMASPEAKISSPMWIVGRTPVNWRGNISLKVHCTSCYILVSNCPRNLWQSSGNSLTGFSIHLELADSSPTRRCSPKNSQELPVKKSFQALSSFVDILTCFPRIVWIVSCVDQWFSTRFAFLWLFGISSKKTHQSESGQEFDICKQMLVNQNLIYDIHWNNLCHEMIVDKYPET